MKNKEKRIEVTYIIQSDYIDTWVSYYDDDGDIESKDYSQFRYTCTHGIPKSVKNFYKKEADDYGCLYKNISYNEK